MSPREPGAPDFPIQDRPSRPWSDYEQLVIDKLAGLERSIRDLRDECRSTYAREADCAGRHERETDARQQGLRRAHGRLDDHEGRLRKLEDEELEQRGARGQRARVSGWVLALAGTVIGGVLVGLIVWLVTRGGAG